MAIIGPSLLLFSTDSFDWGGKRLPLTVSPNLASFQNAVKALLQTVRMVGSFAIGRILEGGGGHYLRKQKCSRAVRQETDSSQREARAKPAEGSAGGHGFQEVSMQSEVARQLRMKGDGQ